MAKRGNYHMQDPGFTAVAVTPSDTAEIEPCRAIYIGGAGDLKIKTAAGDTVTFSGALAGSVIPMQAKLVFSTGTTATNIVAIY